LENFNFLSLSGRLDGCQRGLTPIERKTCLSAVSFLKSHPFKIPFKKVSLIAVGPFQNNSGLFAVGGLLDMKNVLKEVPPCGQAKFKLLNFVVLPIGKFKPGNAPLSLTA
jgi:hypothetical protein